MGKAFTNFLKNIKKPQGQASYNIQNDRINKKLGTHTCWLYISCNTAAQITDITNTEKFSHSFEYIKIPEDTILKCIFKSDDNKYSKVKIYSINRFMGIIFFVIDREKKFIKFSNVCVISNEEFEIIINSNLTDISIPIPISINSCKLIDIYNKQMKIIAEQTKIIKNPQSTDIKQANKVITDAKNQIIDLFTDNAVVLAAEAKNNYEVKINNSAKEEAKKAKIISEAKAKKAIQTEIKRVLMNVWKPLTRNKVDAKIDEAQKKADPKIDEAKIDEAKIDEAKAYIVNIAKADTEIQKADTLQ